MRMIDANALQDQYIAKMEEVVKSTTITDISLVSLETLSLLCGYTLIIDAPTIEAELVMPAYVIVDEDGNMECSNCGSDNCFDDYCGHCGAKLIGTRKDDEEND